MTRSTPVKRVVAKKGIVHVETPNGVVNIMVGLSIQTFRRRA